MSKFGTKIVIKQVKQPLSGKFVVVEKDVDFDKMVILRGEKSKLLFELSNDLKKISATQTVCLGTEEEFAKTWGPFKSCKNYIRSTLKGFGVKNPVLVQHRGNVLIWDREVIGK